MNRTLLSVKAPPLFGMREACESIVCPGDKYNWNRKGMEKCFRDSRDEIKKCCVEECPDGFGRDECIEACGTEMIYPIYDEDEYPIQLQMKWGKSSYVIIPIIIILLITIILLSLI